MRPRLLVVLLVFLLVGVPCLAFLWGFLAVLGPAPAPSSSPSPSPEAVEESTATSIDESDWDALGQVLGNLQEGRTGEDIPPQARAASPFTALLLERYQASVAGRDPGPAGSEELALAYEYLFGSPERTAQTLESFGRTFCLWRMGRVWPGARRKPLPPPLPAWARCPLGARPYLLEGGTLTCPVHRQSLSTRFTNPTERPSELYDQLAMGYFRPERSQLLKDALDPAVPSGARPGESVVDFGCGVGCYTWSMARAVGPKGQVLAVDIDAGVLDFIDFVADRRAMPQVRTLLVSRNSPNLPAGGADRIYMIDVYNVVAGIDLGTRGRPGPRAIHMLQKLVNGLKSGGRLVVIDFLPEGQAFHVAETQAVRNMGDLGLELLDRRQARRAAMYVLTFRKP